jgi:hypothetical protein
VEGTVVDTVSVLSVNVVVVVVETVVVVVVAGAHASCEPVKK